MQDANRDGHDPTTVFYEEDIIALQELDANERYVPLSRLCATLGLDEEGAVQAAIAHSTLSSGLRSIAGDVVLRVDLVPLWLAMIDTASVNSAVRSKLSLYQQECASVLWQAFKPQGFGPEDTLLPEPAEMEPAELAYQGMMAQAALARQQMLVERQLQTNREEGNRIRGRLQEERPAPSFELARLVRRVAHTLAARSRRNEYGGVYSGLYRQFGISSYRNLHYGRLREALDWLERWHSDMLGEPEPPPDI
ncbi:MAG: phage antirepressor N-terminal domain-containing protein [Chloroflexota bacterium]|nr:phage antirepressor N-terminal domain-containing protein [Chloroflexota bacterium]